MSDESPHSPDEVLRCHAEALAFFGRGVHAVLPDRWDLPTPDEDWTVRDLVNHLTVEQLWVPPLVDEGLDPAAVGDRFDGDVLGDDPAAAWDAAAEAARRSWERPGALEKRVHLSYGVSSGLAYCAQMTADATVHGWDLARAVGADPRVPESLVAFSLREFGGYSGSLADSGLFAPPVEIPENAPDADRLLALTGRSPGWRP
ncbi:TIGR03086 family metal-binding protein [Streptomyces thermolineatus]|uniref:TIGR03086 family metal-binding protein n=1 Tax=Streptomyces thermolineatus TaxID=44033 RepID=A0ABN3L048_9ACTN